jgi:hypothetical protein
MMGAGMRRHWRRRLLFAGIFLALYIGSYALLSSRGEYRIDMTGNLRPLGGIALMDVYYWQPKRMYFRVYRSVSGERDVSGNLLGWCYSPLILFDRTVWHHDHRI